MRRIFLFLSCLIFFFLFFLLPQKASAENITISGNVEANSDFKVSYTDFKRGICYVIRIATFGTYADPEKGLSIPCYEGSHIYFTSDNLEGNGDFSLSSRSFIPGSYRLILYKYADAFGLRCSNRIALRCDLREQKIVPFTVVPFSSSCQATVDPTIIVGKEFSVFVVGKFINNIDKVTLQLLDGQSADPLDAAVPIGLTSGGVAGSTSRTATAIVPEMYVPGRYKYAVLAPKTQGGAEEQICVSNAFDANIDPDDPTPPSTTCTPPDFDSATNQCADSRCRVTSRGICELPYQTTPTSLQPISPIPTITLAPLTGPVVAPFTPQPCTIGGNAGIQTALGCIATSPAGLVSSLLRILLGIAGAVAVLLIIYSGYRMMTSAGNPEVLQGARETLTSAIVGLLFIIFSLVLLEVIGVDILRIPGLTK